MMKKLLMITTVIFVIWTTACQKADTSAKPEAKTNTNPTADAPKNSSGNYVFIADTDVKNLNKGLTPSVPCSYLEKILKQAPSPYSEEYSGGEYKCFSQYLMLKESEFEYSAHGNKDYISGLRFSQTIGAKVSSDNATKMLGLMLGNMADVLKQATGQTLPKEVAGALADKKELKYVFDDGTSAKPRAYQLHFKHFDFKTYEVYVVWIYFE